MQTFAIWFLFIYNIMKQVLTQVNELNFFHNKHLSRISVSKHNLVRRTVSLMVWPKCEQGVYLAWPLQLLSVRCYDALLADQTISFEPRKLKD